MDQGARRLRFAALLTLLILFCAGFIALGIWQIERRSWKLDLIAKVDARVAARPVAPPGPERWPTINFDRDAYRHVVATGHFLPGRQTFVQAVTVGGPGYWVMTPLRTDEGFTLLVNRGFVPGEHDSVAAPPGPQNITGLLRLSEPGGGFLQANDPARDAWHSRDVAAIAAARKLGRVAPYFIDQAADGSGAPPIGGLTIIRFHNAHLIYAITWFTLAALSAGAVWLLLRRRRNDG